MTRSDVEREGLRLLCAIILRALPLLPADAVPDPAGRSAAEAAETALAMLADADDPIARHNAVAALASGLTPLGDAGYGLPRLAAMVFGSNGEASPMPTRARSALGALLKLAVCTAYDGTYYLDPAIWQREAVRSARSALHEADCHIEREARTDWPALCARLDALETTRQQFGALDIQLSTLAVLRDHPPPAGIARAARRRARRPRRPTTRRAR